MFTDDIIRQLPRYACIFAEKDDKSARTEEPRTLAGWCNVCTRTRAHVSRSLHRGPRYNRACIWQYLTCFRKRSLVTEMRSPSDNSYVEYYTVEELPLCRIARAMHVLLRMHRARARLSVSNFRIIRPLSAIRQFRQFRNGTWEYGAARLQEAACKRR